MHAAILRGLNKFTFLDYFKYSGQIKPIAGAQTSVNGFVGTIVMLLIVLGYSANATVRFLQTPDSVDVQHFPMQQQNDSLVPTCINVPHLNDLTYFAYDFQEVIYTENGTKLVYPISIKHGAGRSATGEKSEGSFCINSNATHARLRGFCSPYSCSFVQFHLWTCGANDPRNPTQNATNCQSDKTLKDVLEKNYVDVTYSTDAGDVVLHTTPKIEAGALFTTSFVYNETTVNPDLLRTFSTYRHTNLVHEGDNYALSYFFNQTKPYKPVLEVRMILSSTWTKTIASHRTSADLLSAFGAFFGVVNSAFALLFLWYNENKFYKLAPNWKRIDDDFQIVPEEEEYVPTTSVGKPAKRPSGVKRTSGEKVYSRQDELNSVAERESFSYMVDNVQ